MSEKYLFNVGINLILKKNKKLNEIKLYYAKRYSQLIAGTNHVH